MAVKLIAALWHRDERTFFEKLLWMAQCDDTRRQPRIPDLRSSSELAVDQRIRLGEALQRR